VISAIYGGDLLKSRRHPGDLHQGDPWSGEQNGRLRRASGPSVRRWRPPRRS